MHSQKDDVLRLQGISGYIKPGMMVCCLGAPDAGITTFFDVLTGRQQGGLVVSALTPSLLRQCLMLPSLPDVADGRAAHGRCEAKPSWPGHVCDPKLSSLPSRPRCMQVTRRIDLSSVPSVTFKRWRSRFLLQP